jgi:ABC-type phosphate transport system ATPase subunit
MSKDIITIKNLNIYYEKNCVLKNINLNIPEKQITAIMVLQAAERQHCSKASIE